MPYTVFIGVQTGYGENIFFSRFFKLYLLRRKNTKKILDEFYQNLHYSFKKLVLNYVTANLLSKRIGTFKKS